MYPWHRADRFRIVDDLADKDGIYNNQYLLWELYGPEEEDYTNLLAETWNASVCERDDRAEVEIKFTIDRPGNYRLRVATSDVAGRSTVVYKDISIVIDLPERKNIILINASIEK